MPAADATTLIASDYAGSAHKPAEKPMQAKAAAPERQVRHLAA
jgi:hypothetical protein